MDPLLFVVEHRGWLWLVLVALAVALNVVWLRVGPRLSTRLRAVRLRARLGEASALETAIEGDEVTLAGTLELSGDPTDRFEGGGTAAATTTAPVRPTDVVGALAISRSGDGLTLKVGGVEVGLAGDLEVLVGSTGVYPGQRFSRLGGSTERQLFTVDDDALLAMASYRAAFRSLQAGDAVRVRGYLARREAPVGAESYRAGGGQWALSPQHTIDPEKAKGWPMAAAFEGAPSIALPGWRRLSRKIVAVTVVWTLAVAALGVAVLMTRGVFFGRYEHPAAGLPGYCYREPVTPLTYVSLALPVAGGEKLQNLRSTLGERCLWREQDLDQLIALHRLEPGCEEVASLLADHGALGRVGADLDRCMATSPTDEATRLRALLGRFDQVSEHGRTSHRFWLYRHSRLIAEAHLLAGESEQAMFGLRRRAADLNYYGEGVRHELPASHELAGFSVACLADGLTREARDPEARHRLRIHAELGLRHTACPLVYAERLPDAERRRLLRRVLHSSETHRWEALLLLATFEPSAVEEAPQGFVGGALGTLSVGPMGMAPRSDVFGPIEAGALEAIEAIEAPGQRTTVLRAELHARATRLELALGEIEAARRHARRVVEELERIDASARPERMRFEWYQLALARQAVVELWDGEVDAADELIARVRATAQSEADVHDLLLRLAALRGFVADGETTGILQNGMVRGQGQRAAWRSVELGDAEGIALAMAGRDPPFGSHALPLWLLRLPADARVIHDLARWRDRHYGYPLSLWTAFLAHAWDLQAARAFGDDEWIAEVEPVYRAHREAYLDRHDLGLAFRLIEAP